MSKPSVEAFEEFVDQCRRAVSQQVAGHTEPFQNLWSRADDVVLMGASGSHAIGWDEVSASLSWASSHLDFGNWSAENLLTGVVGNLGFTLDLEHISRRVNGKTEERTLRVSQGYRFEDGRWRVLFRHGDPMAERIQLPGAQASKKARQCSQTANSETFDPKQGAFRCCVSTPTTTGPKISRVPRTMYDVVRCDLTHSTAGSRC